MLFSLGALLQSLHITSNKFLNKDKNPPDITIYSINQHESMHKTET